mmetsp:Transcript_55757/g.150258  ORF Transcript_55757/g.150258 Transcript_55757/m.150258 type:complete len:338 (+) Transcript_55757:1-1014(+)
MQCSALSSSTSSLTSPSADDRLRFGFVKSAARAAASAATATVAEATAGTGGAERRRCQPEALSLEEASVELVSLLQRTLGDPDATLPLLRARSSAHKFDFKGRINELTGQNRALRSALAEKRDGHRMLADAMSHIQTDMNWRLRSVADEASQAKQQLNEREKMAEMLQEAVRAVWREEVTPGMVPIPASSSGSTGACEEKQSTETQEQLSALRQCCAAEASRAALAEAVAKQREEELVALRHEMEELKVCCSQSHEKATRATHLVRAAGAILNRQLEDSKQQVMLSVGREQAQAEQLAKAEARIGAFEARLAHSAAGSKVAPSFFKPAGCSPRAGGA